MSKTTLNWNQRFAIIDRFKPSDEQICSAFGVDQSALTTARHLRSAGGQFSNSTDVDVESYASLFSNGETVTTSTKRKTADTSSTSTSTTTVKTGGEPLTATKKVKEPKKRGRKGDKIKNAFAAIPTSATPADDFAKQHNVSLTVLRQGKRFDPTSDAGKVHVKKVAPSEGADKVLCIWRDIK